MKEDDGRRRVEDDADGAERGDDISPDHHLHVGQPGWVLHHPGRAWGCYVGGGRGHFRENRSHVEDSVFLRHHCARTSKI